MAGAAPKYRPGRALIILGLILLVLGVWTFWPGTDHAPKLGLDLQGGTQVVLKPQTIDGQGAVTEQQLSQAVDIIRQRVNGLGVSESTVTTQGSGGNAVIVVAIPGVNEQGIADVLQQTAKLNFRPVYTTGVGVDFNSLPTATPTPSSTSTATSTPGPSAGAGSPSPSASATGNGRPASELLQAQPAATPTASGSPSASPAPSTTQTTNSSASPAPTASPSPSGSGAAAPLPPIQSKENDAALQSAYVSLDCTSDEALQGGRPDDPVNWIATCSQDGASKYLLQPAFIEGTDITDASAQINGAAWEVTLSFNSEGAAKLAEVSGQLVNLPDCSTGATPCNAFGIVLDGLVVSSPRFNQAIIGGTASITGNFTAEEAQNLANVLKFGALPITLEIASAESITPSDGSTALAIGVVAGAVGLALVVLYMLLYYRALGLVAVASLLVAALGTYFAIVVLGNTISFTLTLAGVAGAIVAIGITADSFIVYFERIRDEIREGRSLRVACEEGWGRARRTLLAADFVSLLAAVVLYLLSIDTVRGFAFTLGLTTIIDVVVAFLFTRPIVALLARNRWFTSGHPLTGLDPRRLGVTTLTGRPQRRPAAEGPTGEDV